MEVWGAAGGKDEHDGGKGGYSTGTVYLSQDDKLYVYVGGEGLSDATGIGGGWNGGGDAGISGWSGGGGGMTQNYYYQFDRNANSRWQYQQIRTGAAA